MAFDHISKAARPLVTRVVEQHSGWSWMTVSDWTDFTIERLRWKLDADKKDPGTLQQWERAVIFKVLRLAKEQGKAFKFEGKLRSQVRDILRPVERNVIE